MFIAMAFAALLAGAAPAAVPEPTTEQTIIDMEKQALERWIHGDPDGPLAISAPDVVYFDPALDTRLDGLEALKRYYEPIRGKIHAERFELLNPKVQLVGDAAVLTYNFVSWDESGQDDRWNCTEVYRRDPVGWRVIQTHFSYTKISR